MGALALSYTFLSLENRKGRKEMDIELLKTKSLSDLREIAKLAGIKSVTTYRKGALLNKLIELEEKSKDESAPEQEEVKAIHPEVILQDEDTEEEAEHPP